MKSFLFVQQAPKLFKLAGAFSLAGFVALLMSTNALAEEVATGIDYEKDSENIRTLTFDDIRGARFCELFFIKVKGDMKELQVYNPTGLNNMAETKDSCPDSLVNKIDMAGLKEHYKMDGIYYNKPRHWILDKITLPVGAKRNFDGMEWYWMAASHMPAETEMKPGFLTYKHVPVERKSTFVFRAGKPVFLMDDADGKTWVMKTYRDAHGQTYDNLKNLASRYKSLPEGYSFRVKTLEKDLVLKPSTGKATVMQDEFENTFDYLGDGSANYIP
jgi:hypothetical protein